MQGAVGDTHFARQPSLVHMDALIVGAGFAGLYALHRLRELGLRCLVVDKADDVGGTWYWNRYPGARCDVPSFDYSYSFSEELEQEWRWTERYATQPEILRYIQHVADRFGLRNDVQLSTTVVAADWHDDSARWAVRTDAGDVLDARFLIMATGCLSVPNVPTLPGIDDFEGRVLHTGTWPHEPIDFTDRRVAVFGTGSSGIQVIPEIARQARDLTVLQRTPNFSLPARNRPIDDETFTTTVAGYRQRRARARASYAGFPTDPPRHNPFDLDDDARQQEYEKHWEAGGATLVSAFTDLLVDSAANDTAADFVRAKICEIVQDPQTAAALSPHGYPIATKRVCVDTDYYATFNRPNVELIDLRRTPLQHVNAHSVVTSQRQIPADDIVLATGFDAVTGALRAIDIAGREGVRLRSEWADGARSYLGLAVHGFPNLFMVTGPQSPSVRTNMIVAIEQHVDWITACVARLSDHENSYIEATAQAQEEWVNHAAALADATLFPKADSWYVGANIAGKPRVVLPYIGSLAEYGETITKLAEDGYRGFLTRPAQRAQH